MTILDPKLQPQVTFNPVCEEDDPTYEYDERKYEHLLKDIPCDKDGVPYIEVCGYRQMTISVGSLARLGPSVNPVKSLRKMTDYVRLLDDCKFAVDAAFETGHWPLGQGFQRLGEFLEFLGNEEIRYEHWRGLRITLPDIELPYDTVSLPMLPLDTFASLQHLTWRGHRKQLLASWLPLLPSVLRMLTTLKIECNIALQDCCHLLYYGSNLKKVTLKIIQKDLVHEQMLGFITPPDRASRPLEYLHLVSYEDIGPLLSPFNFPSLRNISFILGYPTWSTFTDLKIWKTLEKIHIMGNLLDSDCNWIRSQCSPTTQYDFRRSERPVNGTRSFLHKDVFQASNLNLGML